MGDTSIRRCLLSRRWLWRWGHRTRRHLTQHLKEEREEAMCTTRGKEFAAKGTASAQTMQESDWGRGQQPGSRGAGGD